MLLYFSYLFYYVYESINKLTLVDEWAVSQQVW